MNEVEKGRLLPVRAEKVFVVDMDEERPEVGRRRKPRAVAAVVVGKKVRAHSQILRLRAEDSRLGEDGFCGARLFPRHMLPASPLGSIPLTSGASKLLIQTLFQSFIRSLIFSFVLCDKRRMKSIPIHTEVGGALQFCWNRRHQSCVSICTVVQVNRDHDRSLVIEYTKQYYCCIKSFSFSL